MPHSALVIEDHRDIADLIRLHFADIDCETSIAADGASGLRLATALAFDIVVLDIVLPDIDGFEVCRRLRAMTSRTRILMLTSRGDESDRVAGIEMGADDYVTKPFSMKELIARVKAQLRRLSEPPPRVESAQDAIRIGALSVDPKRRCAFVQDREIELTPTEFNLLFRLAREPGRVWTRTELLQAVWGYSHDGYEHTVNTHINRLRAKIERDPTRPVYVRTVWGTGYRLAEPLETSPA
jgi:two-component system OmpR family response regulator